MHKGTYRSPGFIMAKDVVAGMSITDPSIVAGTVKTVLVISTEYKETTRLIPGPNGKYMLVDESDCDFLLMEDPKTGQCYHCRLTPGTLVNLAAPEFAPPIPARKAE